MRKTGNAACGIPAHLVFKAHLLTFMLDCHRANSQLIFCPLKRTETSHLKPEKLREKSVTLKSHRCFLHTQTSLGRATSDKTMDVLKTKEQTEENCFFSFV